MELRTYATFEEMHRRKSTLLDPFGRRIQKSSSTGATNYLYDDRNSVEEIDQAGSELAHYAQGTGIDEPLAILRGGTAGFYEQDGLGSVTALTDSTGVVLRSYTYDTFGNVTASTGSFVNPYQYTGRDYDAETGLRYYRERNYDSSTGRFLSEDPLGLNAGTNMYEYAHGLPTGFTDPSGMTSFPGLSSLGDAINWVRGKYHGGTHIEDGTTGMLAGTPAMGDIRKKFKKNHCASGVYCGNFNSREYFTTFNLVGQTVGGFCAKITNLGDHRILVDAWNDWGLASGSRWPQLGKENNRTHPSVEDMLLHGAPFSYPSSTLNNRDHGWGHTVRTRYIWIEGSPCCGN